MAKKALLVGINDYNGRGDLKGCVNDILDMHFTLGSVFDFVNEEVRVLTDRRATSEAIKHRLNWLVKDAKDGDYLVFQRGSWNRWHYPLWQSSVHASGFRGTSDGYVHSATGSIPGHRVADGII